MHEVLGRTGATPPRTSWAVSRRTKARGASPPASGRWTTQAKEPLPTEQQLARDQGVSVNTVRRAVDLLVQEGLVYRRQGSGTYVSVSPAAGTGYAVGVAVPSLTYYYPRVITGIERELSRHGCRMILRCTEWDSGPKHEAVEELTRSGSDGLIVVPTLGGDGPHPWLENPGVSAIPMVLVERGVELPTTSHPGSFSDRIRR
ncbi:GntR family transcriptional regulator [Streptomyces sp. NPDC006923]|uniref:GntR family transcriptional regulator n=1 Tax=Streptomyces sp. NPDC006923 TaxID=3155355 RepID=UPI0033D61391